MSVTVGSIILALIPLAVWVFRYLTQRSKADSQKLEASEKTIENVEKANKAIGRAKSNKSIRDKLRARYEIK